MWNPLLDEGKIGRTLLTTWIAKENLRTRSHWPAPAPTATASATHAGAFCTWCADADIPEIRQLAATVERWWPGFEAFTHTPQQRQERRHQPRHQTRRPRRLWLPQRRQTNAYAHAA
jgi:hypothetical protein